MIFWITDRWGEQKGCIGDVQEAVHRDELNGEDSLTLVLPEDRLSKGDRVVWRDRWDAWHEHVVSEVTAIHEDGSLYYSAYCENSIAETLLDYVDEIVCEDVKVPVALGKALAPTRWVRGRVDDLGVSTLYCFQTSAHEAISKLLEQWGGEFSTEIRVDAEGVYERRLNVEARRGQDAGKLFTYGHDMSSVEQEVAADDVVTRLHVFGKGTGYTDAEAGYTERLTFAAVNGGKDYVEDNSAKLRWGLPDGSGGVKHAEGVAVFEDCDDEEELLALGREELAERSHPHVSYRATVAALSDYGYDYDDARPGDTVTLRDKPLGLRLEGRVTAVARYLVDTAATEITLGDGIRSITDVMGRQRADLAWLKSRSPSWSAAAELPSAYLNRVIDRLNEQMNATGGYAYWEEGVGITVYDRPKDQHPTQAMQLNGMGFRIANSKKADGEWDWRTFGTGDGFVADEIVAGVLRCGDNEVDLTNGVVTLVDGMIRDGSGKNYWNLATGLINTLRGYIGGFTISDKALYNGPDSLDSTVRGVYLGADGLETSDGYNRIVLKDGVMRGYQGQYQSGSLAPAATIYEVDSETGERTGRAWRGLMARGEIFEIRADKVAVLEGSGLDETSQLTKTCDVSIGHLGNVSVDADGCMTVHPRNVDYKLVHGMLTTWNEEVFDATHLASRSYVSDAVKDAKDSMADKLEDKVDALEDKIERKADSGHTHSYGSLTGKPSIPTFTLLGNILYITAG